jgi:hypothetical protein
MSWSTNVLHNGFQLSIHPTGVLLVPVKSYALRLVPHCLVKKLVRVTGGQGALLGTNGTNSCKQLPKSGSCASS